MLDMLRKPAFLPILTFLLLTARLACAQSPEVVSLKKSLSQITDSAHYVDALNRLAMLYYEKSIDSTFEYAVHARQIADRLGYEKGQVDAINNLGVFFDIKGNLQLSLKYYNEAHAGYQRIKDTANIVQTQMNIAMVYTEIGKDDRAVQHFNLALARGKGLAHDSIMSLAIYNYLLQYPARFNAKQTTAYIAQAKKIATRYHDRRTLIAIDQLTADQQIDHGDRNAGIALLDTTINQALQAKLFYVSMDMLIDMADRLVTTDPPKAAIYYNRALAVAKRNDYLFYSQLVTRKLFDFYDKQHDNVNAALYARQLMALNDEQSRLNNHSSVDYLDYALKDQQLKALATRSKYQTVFLLLVSLVCVLAIVVIVLIRRSLLHTRKLNQQIGIQNMQMHTALAALEESQADNTRMMKIAAHDLRNPIGAISALTTLMLDAGPRPEDDRMMLDIIRTSANNSLELVSDLLQVHTRAEAMPKEPVDLDRMLHYCVDLLENKASAKAQRIELSSQPLTVPANREKLWRVVSNLIGNAVKFSPTGARILVTLKQHDGRALIAVKDNGIGIPAELGAKIFDMFTDAKREGTAGEQAFGLGLAISKQIVEAHNGRIWFESKPGDGTTFFVELPGA